MNEEQWLTSTDPQQVMRFLVEGRGSDRQLRFFGCACCRQVWDLLAEDCFRDAVAVAERFADKQASSKELAVAKRVSGAALERNGLAGVTGPRYCALGSAWSCTRNPQTAAMYPLWVFTDEAQRQWEVLLIRDIFHNPFRSPPSIAPSVLQWHGGTVKRLAEDAYEHWVMPAGTLDNARVAVLADALEEAGGDAELVGHLRGPGPHVRGCHVVDLILGRL